MIIQSSSSFSFVQGYWESTHPRQDHQLYPIASAPGRGKNLCRALPPDQVVAKPLLDPEHLSVYLAVLVHEDTSS